MSQLASWWNRLGVRARIFAVTLSVLWLSLFAGYQYLHHQVAEEIGQTIREDLEIRVRLVADRIAAAGVPPGSAEFAALCERLAGEADARLTVFSPAGEVLGDFGEPGRSGSSPALSESAAHEPVTHELVTVALQRGHALVEAESPEGDRLLFAAVPQLTRGTVSGVLRLGIAATSVDLATSGLDRWVTVAGLAAMFVALMVAIAAAHIGSLAARRLTKIAASMADGDLTTRSEPSGHDEFAVLGRALDALAENLSDTLKQLREEKGRLDRVLSSMHEGVLLADSAGKVLLVNSALVEMLYLPPNPVGKPVHDVIEHLELRDLMEAAREGEPQSAEVSLQRGPSRKILASARSLPRGTGVLVVLVDITEQRRLETVRQEFVSNASHELRTPIAAILSAAETLQSIADGERGPERGFLDMISRNAQRLKTLVDDLLALSHIESGTIKFTPENVRLRPAVEALMNDFAPAARKRSTRLFCLVPSDIQVVASPRGLQHVVGNLVDNAIKYCPAGAKVTVEARKELGRGVIRVIDDGPGIPREHRARIFERFYRIDAGRSRELGGTGLGLSIVKHWVEAMGGSIRVDPAEGKGTVFTVSLALAQGGSNPGATGPLET